MSSKKNELIPKEPVIHPVHPRNVRFHGLFGIPYFRQHFVYDVSWQHSALTQQFGGMADILFKRRDFNVLENKFQRDRLVNKDKGLKNLGRDGRTKLQMTLMGNNSMKVSNILINHRDMQRLYQNMPLHTVVEKMDQQTFVYRKERDRLICRTKKLEMELDNKLMEEAAIERRIQFHGEYVLEEDLRSNDIQKKISNSRVRLSAIKYLNSAYKKMLQVLQQDANFYEPILRSLKEDSEDQTKFIKHVLVIGTPAIARFKELAEEYKSVDEQGRKNIADRILQNLKRSSRSSFSIKDKHIGHDGHEGAEKLKRYVRETESMLLLKFEMNHLENVIKLIKFTTLSSKAKEICPRIKMQKQNNSNMAAHAHLSQLTHESLTEKYHRADIIYNNLVHNLDEDELKRQQCIKFLEDAIKEEEQITAEKMKYLEHCAKVHVMVRYSLWSIHDLLRHVDRVPNKPRLQYPNTYLKLPLLKFEMLSMHAVPPDVLDENVIALVDSAKDKLNMLLSTQKQEPSQNDMRAYMDVYHNDYIEGLEDVVDEGKSAKNKLELDRESEEKLEMKQRVPTRKAVKQLSAKIVEEFAKKDQE